MPDRTVKAFWDRIAGVYDLVEKLNCRANLAMEKEVLQWISPGSRVMDCAAGTGTFSLVAAQKASYVCCTDLSPVMLKEAEKKALRANVAHMMEFAQRDLFSGAPEVMYDVVIAGNVLHLVDTPEQAVGCLLEAVKPGGRLILPTYLQGEVGMVAQIALKVYRMLGFCSKHRYTLESYQSMLESCGVEILCIKRLQGQIPVGFAVIRRMEQKEVEASYDRKTKENAYANYSRRNSVGGSSSSAL